MIVARRGSFKVPGHGGGRLRVLHVDKLYHPCIGGIERFVQDLCEACGLAARTRAEWFSKEHALPQIASVYGAGQSPQGVLIGSGTLAVTHRCQPIVRSKTLHNVGGIWRKYHSLTYRYST